MLDHEVYGFGTAQLGERQTEDLKVPGPIPGRGKSAILIQMKM